MLFNGLIRTKWSGGLKEVNGEEEGRCFQLPCPLYFTSVLLLLSMFLGTSDPGWRVKLRIGLSVDFRYAFNKTHGFTKLSPFTPQAEELFYSDLHQALSEGVKGEVGSIGFGSFDSLVSFISTVTNLPRTSSSPRRVTVIVFAEMKARANVHEFAPLATFSSFSSSALLQLIWVYPNHVVCLSPPTSLSFTKVSLHECVS